MRLIITALIILPPMEPHWSVVQLSVGFVFIFTAFKSQGAIQETVINNYVESREANATAGFYLSQLERHDGYIGRVSHRHEVVRHE